MTDSSGAAPALRRLRLPLDFADSDMLLVFDTLDQPNGRYVQLIAPRAVTGQIDAGLWEGLYEGLAEEWRGKFLRGDG